MAEISLHEATPADAAAIAAVHVASWRAAYRGIVPDDHLAGLSVARRERQWREWISRGTSVLLASSDPDPDPGPDRLDGFCATRPAEDAEPPEIGALYVDPPAYRTGVGTTLLVEALRRLRAADKREVTLWVFAANAGARAFYDRHGFAPDGAIDSALGAQEIRLRASLASS